MEDKLNIIIVGATGRMGRMLIEAVLNEPKTRLVGAITSSTSKFLGSDAGLLAGLGEVGIRIEAELAPLLAHGVKINGETQHIGAVIDFSNPENSVLVAILCAQANIPLVIGVTGYSSEEATKVDCAARHTAMIRAANYSIGVTIATAFAQKMAAALPDQFDIEILEMHHNQKSDSPSGTALALGKAAALGRGIDHDSHAVYSREGRIGARKANEIGYATLRGGDVVGEHEVIFASNGERVSLGHKAGSRRIFADGAVHAALFLAKQPHGLYTMMDVLNLK